MESYEVEIDGKTYQGMCFKNVSYFEMYVTSAELILQDSVECFLWVSCFIFISWESRRKMG